MDKKKLERIEEVSQEVEAEKDEMDILDVLLDETNTDPIVLVNSNGQKVSFEQIAIIPYNDKVYAVLKPIDEMENVADDEAIVFYVDDSGDEPVLMVETDEKTAINVFDEYYNLLDQEEANAKKKKSTK